MPTIKKKYPPIWHKELLKKSARQEKDRLKTLKEVETALDELEKKYHWDEAYIFGSLCGKKEFRQTSDVDIALMGLNKFDLYALVGDISLRLNRQVDVVRMEECGFSKSIISRGIKWTKKKR